MYFSIHKRVFFYFLGLTTNRARTKQQTWPHCLQDSMGTSVESSKHQSERTCQSFDVHFALTSFNSPARNPWPEKSFRRRRSTRRRRRTRHRRPPTTTQLQRPRVVRRSRLGPFNSVCKGQTRAAGFELSRLAVKLTRC